jgi:hypothetical protein
MTTLQHETLNDFLRLIDTIARRLSQGYKGSDPALIPIRMTMGINYDENCVISFVDDSWSQSYQTFFLQNEDFFSVFLLLGLAILKYRQYFLMLQTLNLNNENTFVGDVNFVPDGFSFDVSQLSLQFFAPFDFADEFTLEN